DVDDVFRGNRASETCLAARFKYRLAFSKLSKSWRHIAHCDDAKAPIAFVQQQQSEGGVAKSGRIRQHCLKYRSEVAKRTRYDTRAPRRGRLLLQRFGEVRGALTQFVEESRILDGNDGLVREGFHQCHLLVGERSDLNPVNGDRPYQVVAFDDWNREHCPD